VSLRSKPLNSFDRVESVKAPEIAGSHPNPRKSGAIRGPQHASRPRPYELRQEICRFAPNRRAKNTHHGGTEKGKNNFAADKR
jgi:hypothetical protein